MNSKWTIILCLIMILSIQGCETAKGMHKDVNNTWEGMKSKKGWIHKTDGWIKKNMW